MAYSTQRSVSDGTLRVLMLDIEFFDKSEITAYFNNIPTTAYVWATDTSLRFNANVPAGVEVLVRRTTDLASPRHVFSDGAQFKASTFDDDFRQILHIAQEAIEGANVGDIYQTLNMHGNKITNVGVATDRGDAVSFGQYQDDASGAYQSRVAAAASASQSEAARAAAVVARTGSEAAQSAAESARSTAQASASAASSSATASAGSASLAGAYANYPVDQLVSPGMYSAFHWAMYSATYKDMALTSKNAAAASAAAALVQADRAKTEADKLGNMNTFAGTILDVTGMSTRFYGMHSVKQALYIRKQASSDETDFFSWSYEPNGVVYQRDRSGVAKTSLEATGNYAVSGTLTSNGGMVIAAAPGVSDFSQYVFSGPAGTRGTIYSGSDNNINIRAGGSVIGLTAYTDGNVRVGNDLSMKDAYITSTGNIVAPWLRGGSLASALDSVKSGTRLRSTPVLLWLRGTDTVGGTGDQGAPGSTFRLREPLLVGDFIMLEIYGAAVFLSTANCVLGLGSSYQHNIPFDSSGSMRFLVSADGYTVTVQNSNPSNQYGIRQLFVFKLTIA